MALPSTRNDREYQRFVEAGSGNPAVRVVLYDASGNTLLVGTTPGDGVANSAIGAVAIEGFNGTTWDRIRVVDANEAPAASVGLLGTAPYLRTSGPGWSQHFSGAAIGDGDTGAGSQAAALQGFNGTTWDRVRLVDANETPGASVGLVGVAPYLRASGPAWSSQWWTAAAMGDAGNGDFAPAVIPFGLSGTSTYDRVRVANLLKTAQASALASGSDLTVWTPGAGKKVRLFGLRGRGSNAGRYEARDATGTVIAYFYLAANTWTDVVGMPANGYLSTAANNALLVRNQSGGNSDVDFVAWGMEE
jgi:hypothetical protein